MTKLIEDDMWRRPMAERKQSVLSQDPQCSYDQWLGLASEKTSKHNYHRRTNNLNHGAQVFVNKHTESNAKRHPKLAKQKIAKSSKIPITIPEDPRAPEAFTLNITTPQTKPKKTCLTQSGCVLLSFLVCSLCFLTILLLYLSQATQVMTAGMPDQ